MDLIAEDCDVTENMAHKHGGGLRLSYRSSAVMIGGNVSYNKGNLRVFVILPKLLDGALRSVAYEDLFHVNSRRHGNDVWGIYLAARGWSVW